mmetsp:Transcript_36543/g.62235  ORF Transcript_36543/g.62235 Transcript_36543/m.62235 type:complete len:403 (-) Transcript_36543:303-1511(-)
MTSITTPTFEKLLNKRSCSCSTVHDCNALLRQYFEDSSAPYPDNKKQLLFRIRNPNKSTSSKKPRQLRAKQQFYNRAASLLRIEDADHLDHIFIGISHFSRDVIDHYNNDNSATKAKYFTDYLLPTSLVSNSNLGVEFTVVDKFICLGTPKEKSHCKRNGSCNCKLFLNAPFVTRCHALNQTNSIENQRHQRCETFFSTRRQNLSTTEIAVQSNKANRILRESNRIREDAEATQKKLAEVTKQLDYARKKTSSLAAQQHQHHQIKNEVRSLKRTNAEIESANLDLQRERDYAVSTKAAIQSNLEQSRKKLKTVQRQLRQSSTPAKDDPFFNIKRMGLCRQSLLDDNWHKYYNEASRSLLNFPSLKECLIYISVLFPLWKAASCAVYLRKWASRISKSDSSLD